MSVLKDKIKTSFWFYKYKILVPFNDIYFALLFEYITYISSLQKDEIDSLVGSFFFVFFFK